MCSEVASEVFNVERLTINCKIIWNDSLIFIHTHTKRRKQSTVSATDNWNVTVPYCIGATGPWEECCLVYPATATRIFFPFMKALLMAQRINWASENSLKTKTRTTSPQQGAVPKLDPRLEEQENILKNLYVMCNSIRLPQHSRFISSLTANQMRSCFINWCRYPSNTELGFTRWSLINWERCCRM